MSKSLCATYTQTAIQTGTFYSFAGMNAAPSDLATEATKQTPIRQAGQFSYLQVLADNVGTSRTVTLRKNAAAANLTVAPTNTTAGLYIDSTHTDDFAVGDLVSLQHIVTGAPVYSSMALNFEAVEKHTTLFACAYAVPLAASTTNFFPLGGLVAAGAITEANAQHRIRCGASTVNNIFVRVSTNTRADASTYRLRINGADGNNTLSIGAAATGLFEDTAHTDTLANADLVCLACTTLGGAGSLTPVASGLAIVADSGQSTSDVFALSGNLVTRTAGAGQTFYGIAGRQAAAASEAVAKIRHGFQGSATNLRLRLTANTYTGSATVVLRKNGADVTNTFSIGSGATGIFEDTTHTDTFTATDDICFAISGGTANSISMQWSALTETDTTPPPTGGMLSNPLVAVALAAATVFSASKLPTPQAVAPDTTTTPAVSEMWGPQLKSATALSSRQPTVDPGVFFPYYGAEQLGPRKDLATALKFSAPPARAPDVFVPWQGSINFGSNKALASAIYVAPRPLPDPGVFYPEFGSSSFGSQKAATVAVTKDQRNDQTPFLFQPWTSVAAWGSNLKPTVTVTHGEVESEYVFVPPGFIPTFAAKSVTVTLKQAVSTRSSPPTPAAPEPTLTYPAFEASLVVQTSLSPQVGVWSATPQFVEPSTPAVVQPGGGGSLLQPYFDDLERLYAADKKMRQRELRHYSERRKDAEELRQALQDTYDKALGRAPRLAGEIARATPALVSGQKLDPEIVEQSLDGVLRVLALLQEEIDRISEEDDLEVLMMVL